MKKLAVCMTVATALFADTGLLDKESDAIRCCGFTPAYHPGDPLCSECNESKIYPAYAGVHLSECAWDVYAFGEFLYWQPHNQNTVVAIENVANPPVNTRNEYDNNFGYRPAFRVGAGVVLADYANWILNADYTWYHHNFSKTVSATLPNTLTNGMGGGTAASTYNSIQTKNHFSWDFVNVNVQTNFYIGRRVTVNPYFGLKWLGRKATVSQTLARSTGTGTDYQTATGKREGIGPDVGANMNWLLDWGFSILGKVDLSVLYDYEAKFDQSASIFPAPTITKFRGNTNTIDVFAKGGLGIGWGSYFSCDRFHFNLAASYDIVYDVTPLYNGNDVGLLLGQNWWLEGLTISGQFDF